MMLHDAVVWRFCLLVWFSNNLPLCVCEENNKSLSLTSQLSVKQVLFITAADFSGGKKSLGV